MEPSDTNNPTNEDPQTNEPASPTVKPASLKNAQLPAAESRKREYLCKDHFEEHSGVITAVHVSSDGHIVTAGDDGTLVVLRNMTPGEQRVLYAELEREYDAAYPGREDLYGVRRRNAVSEELRRRLVLARLSGHTKPITCVSALSDGRIVSGSEDGTLRVWTPHEEDEESASDVLNLHSGPVTCVHVLEDGRILSGSADGVCRLWSEEGAGKWASATVFSLPGSLQTIQRFPNGTLLVGSDEGGLGVFSIAPGEDSPECVSHGEPVRSVKILSDREFVSLGPRLAYMWRLDDETGTWKGSGLKGLREAQILSDGKIISFTPRNGVIVARCRQDGQWERVASRDDWRDMVQLTPLEGGRFILRAGWVDEGQWRTDVEAMRLTDDGVLSTEQSWDFNWGDPGEGDLPLPGGLFAMIRTDGDISIYAWKDA